MDREAELAMVRRHIRQGTRHISRQLEIIAGLQARGRDDTGALFILEQFEKVLALHKDHLDRLLR